MVDLLFATGMRFCEVFALDMRDYFTREPVFRIEGEGGGTVWPSQVLSCLHMIESRSYTPGTGGAYFITSLSRAARSARQAIQVGRQKVQRIH